MSKTRNNVVTRFLVVATLALFMVAQHPGVLLSAEVATATTAFKHKPLKHFVAGRRIRIEAKVTDPQGVSLVRCYFRADGEANYVFVGMQADEKDTFAGVLPSPAAGTNGIEYLFLAVNGKNQVVKTQKFRAAHKDAADIPSWQSVAGAGAIVVHSELPQAPAPQGFTDSISTNVVESSLRFGFVAGIYAASQVGGGGPAGTAGGTTAAENATGAAAAAVSAGTAVATAGLSTTAIVGATAAVAAVGVGVAASGGGDGSDSSNGGGDGGGDTTRTGCDQYAGNWAGSLWQRDCTGEIGTDSLRMTVQADCSCTVCGTNGCTSLQIAGDTLSFSVENDNGCGTTTAVGAFTNSLAFSGTFTGAAAGTWEMTKQ